MKNLIFSGRGNVQVTSIILLSSRKFSGAKHLIMGLLLILFLQESFFAQCPSGVSGSGFLTANMCAPSSVTLYYEFSSATELPQTSYRVQFMWGDGTARNVTQPVQTRIVGGLTQWYVRVELNHTYPVNGLCEYVVLMVLYNSSGVQCQDSRQTQIVANWYQDDIVAASGRIAMDPVQKIICEGLPLIDFQFTDVSNFACNLRDFPLAQKPDHMPRHEQFIYGTNPVAGKGIPDLFIKAGTAETSVRLTDASGNPVPNIWTVDPLTGGTVAPYATASGFFEGPVITIPVDAVTGEYSLNKTFKISYNGTGTADQDQFQVTVRNWNICNPWNGSQSNPNGADANIATSRIYIVSGPDASASVMNTPVVCSDASIDLTLKSSVNYTVFEYTTETVPSGIPWIPGKEPVNGTIADTDGNGTEVLIRQLAHYYNSPVTVTYTIVPKSPEPGTCFGAPITRRVIVQPSVFVSAPNPFPETVCSNMPVFIDVTTESSGTYGVKYTWNVTTPPGLGGAFDGPPEGNSFDSDIIQVLINYEPFPQKVTYTITGYTLDQEGALQCAGIPFQKDLWIEPVVELSPMNLLPVVCSGDMTFINVHTTYPEPSKVRYTWTVYAPPDIMGAENGPVNLMEGNSINVPINQTLINVSPFPQVVRYELRGYLITEMGIICPPERISIEEVRVNPSTLLTIQPDDYIVCQGADAMFTAEAAGESITWQWEVNKGAGFMPMTDDPYFSGTKTRMLTISGTQASFNDWIFRARVNGLCGASITSPALLTVNTNPVVDFTAIDPIEVNEGVPVVINGNPTGGSGVWTQHLWSGDVGLLDNLTIQAPTFNSSIPGTYSLAYRVTDNNSCTGEDNLSVIVKVLTGNEEIKGNSFKFSVYPNPVTDLVRLRIDNYDIVNLSYQIVGINGMILQQKKVESNEMQISLKNLHPGIYFLRILENVSEIRNFKIVKN